jgi:predicted Zn-dependent protease
MYQLPGLDRLLVDDLPYILIDWIAGKKVLEGGEKMAGFFYRLGHMIGPKLRQANWVVQSLTGSEADARQAEYAVGQDLARALARQMNFDTDPEVEHLLWELRERITACLTGPRRPFVVRAICLPEVNAFALPGGFLFLTRPLLEFCQWDPHEIAFVIAHEMAHVLLRHAIDRLMADSVIRTAVSRLSMAGGVFRQHLATLASSLLHQGYSRDQELDADRLATQIISHAGFDPTAGIKLLMRLGEGTSESSLLGNYFASHPPVGERVRNIQHALHS